MSQVRGSVSLGKDQQQVTVELQGNLEPHQWAEFVEKLQALVKNYNRLNVSDVKKGAKT